MQIVDAHHHIWNPKDPRYVNFLKGGVRRFWGDFSEFGASYLASDYGAEFEAIGVVKSVHVEAGFDHNDPVEETRILQAMADDPSSNGFPHAIVGRVNFMDPGVERFLDEHSRHPNFRGVRQMLNRHILPLFAFVEHDYLDEGEWRRNFALLRKYRCSFDLSINPPQMPKAAELARQYPDIPMVLCHAGFPIERYAAGIEVWRQGMHALAACPNVYVKISGLGMFDRYCTADSLRRIVLETIELFGVDRAMFGSNFPIDRLSISAVQLWNALDQITAGLSKTERQLLFHDTACSFYRI